jgi:5-methylcytosine-specific restriction endonuclease McrA
MNVLRRPVLVLNRNWQAVNVTNVETALVDCAKGARTAVDTTDMRPMTWDEWVALPIRETDEVIHTPRLLVRVPTVIVASTYDRMPKSRPKLSRKGIAERDGYRCGYTGVHCPDGNLDHVMPRSRGGRDTWENLVWSAKDVNQAKADRTPQEAGLHLRIKPTAPKEVVACALIKPEHPDWVPFLVRHG